MKKLILSVFLLAAINSIYSQWTVNYQHTNGAVTALSFLNSRLGIASFSQTLDGNVILKTSNAGTNWISAYNSMDGGIRTSKFQSTDTILAIKLWYLYVQIYPGGIRTDTAKLIMNNGSINAIQIINKNFVCMMSNVGLFCKTINGGLLWDTLSIKPGGDSRGVNGLHFVNNNTGYCCGNDGLFYKTTNGGGAWQQLSHGLGNINFNYVYFPTNDTGFAVAGSNLYKTVNGGNNWTQLVNFPTWYNNINGLSCPTAATIYAVGYPNTSISNSPISMSTNSGINWTSYSPFPNGGVMRSISFTRPDTGYAGSEGSLIQKFVSPASGVVRIENELPAGFSLKQNYPNPFNPTTNIKYSITKNSGVILKVFDARGREIETLVNERQNAGVYIVKFESKKLSSGIYFYNLNADGNSETKQMVLIK